MASLQTTLSRSAVLVTILLGGVTQTPLAFGQSRTPPPQRPPRQAPPPARPPVPPRQGPPTRPSTERPQPPRSGPPQRGSRAEGSDPGMSGTQPERRGMPERTERGERSARGERGGGAGERSEHPDRAESRRQVRPPEQPVRPRALPRLVVYPRFSSYWSTRFRNIQSEIIFASRRGYIPVTAIPADVYELTDYSDIPAGWRGYGVVVPPGESLTINLDHPNRAWFRLIICDSWGQAVPGGLSSLLPQFEPKLSYTNVGDEEKAIYILADDPGWMSSYERPFVLNLTRSWNPALVPINQDLIIAGIWGVEMSSNARFSRPMFVMPGFK